MSKRSFTITPRELVLFHRCLSSKICIRIFQVFHEHKVLNISAISRKARCTNNDALKHLRNLVLLGIFQEDFYAGRHTFTLNRTLNTELMKKAIEATAT